MLKNIPFYFSGLQSLKIKETDRIAALTKELRKLGYVIVEKGNGIVEFEGETCMRQSNPIIDTYEDHRMAMAFAPVSICAKKIVVNDPHVVTKSYPNFWKDLLAVGFEIAEKS